MLLAHEAEGRAVTTSADDAVAHAHASGLTVLHDDLVDARAAEGVDAVLQEDPTHVADQAVGATDEREDALGHEVAEDDAVADRRVVQAEKPLA